MLSVGVFKLLNTYLSSFSKKPVLNVGREDFWCINIIIADIKCDNKIAAASIYEETSETAPDKTKMI